MHFEPFKTKAELFTDGSDERMFCDVYDLVGTYDATGEMELQAKLVPRRNRSDYSIRPVPILDAKRVVFNPPATVVLWEDGTKTVVKCDLEDEYNAMTGVALCYMKKALGNTSRGLNKALRNAKNYIKEEKE